MKKIPLSLLCFILTLAPLVLKAETDKQPEVLLRGILKLGSTQAFSLSDPVGTTTSWVRVGQSFRGYKLIAFDPENETLTLAKDDNKFILKLSGSSLEAASNGGTEEERFAEATQLMEIMNFEKMIGDSIDAQTKAMADMMQEEVTRPDGSVDEKLAAFQTKAIEGMFSEIDWKPIKKGMIQAYAEIFTEEELKGMSNFYATPAGQASIEKMPEIQTKSMQVMMPSIMEASQSLHEKLNRYIENQNTAEEEEEEEEEEEAGE